MPGASRRSSASEGGDQCIRVSGVTGYYPDCQWELEHIKIKRKRVQIDRQRKDIQSPAKAGIPMASAEAMLARMLEKTDESKPCSAPLSALAWAA